MGPEVGPKCAAQHTLHNTDFEDVRHRWRNKNPKSNLSEVNYCSSSPHFSDPIAVNLYNIFFYKYVKIGASIFPSHPLSRENQFPDSQTGISLQTPTNWESLSQQLLRWSFRSSTIELVHLRQLFRFSSLILPGIDMGHRLFRFLGHNCWNIGGTEPYTCRRPCIEMFFAGF